MRWWLVDGDFVGSNPKRANLESLVGDHIMDTKRGPHLFLSFQERGSRIRMSVGDDYGRDVPGWHALLKPGEGARATVDRYDETGVGQQIAARRFTCSRPATAGADDRTFHLVRHTVRGDRRLRERLSAARSVEEDRWRP